MAGGKSGLRSHENEPFTQTKPKSARDQKCERSFHEQMISLVDYARILASSSGFLMIRKLTASFIAQKKQCPKREPGASEDT